MKGKRLRRADNAKLMTCTLKRKLNTFLPIRTVMVLCSCLDIALMSSLISVLMCEMLKGCEIRMLSAADMVRFFSFSSGLHASDCATVLFFI